jgi:error-prone DNA polymerase
MDAPGHGRVEDPTPEPAYAALWCKSNYSFLEGASHPEELVRQARDLGLRAIAITDRDGVYGIVRAHVAARDAGMKLIVGSEVTLGDNHGTSTPGLPDAPPAHPVSDAAHAVTPTVVLLSQNRDGYASLCHLISAGRLRNPKGVCDVTIPEVCEHAGGLLALLARGAESVPARTLGTLRDAFGDRLYAVVARHAQPEDSSHETRLRALAGDAGIPLIAATEVLYHTTERRVLQDVLECIRHNTSLDKAGSLLRPNDRHALVTPTAMLERYRDDPGLVGRTLDVAARCAFVMDQIRYRYPSESLPTGQTTASRLRTLTLRGAEGRYGHTVPVQVRDQIDKELALIEELDYCGYFLTMFEIVDFCRTRGILCQGRGSAANSAVCYCLGVTAVDPVRMGLLFERFLSRERAEPPDIDLDIEHDRREEAIQHMYEKYGRDHAAMVANVIRYRGRSAVRDVGKALGYPPTVLDRLSKFLSHYTSEVNLAKEEGGTDLSPRRLERLVALSNEIQDFPRHLSIHPGGFLLGSDPVSDIVPIENATMPDRTVIQWDKTDVEDMGLFKVDLLGLGALTHLHYAFDLLKDHLELETTMARIPAEDPSVYRMLERSDTVGVFQLESRAQMSMLPRLKPRTFYDIVVEVSIVRPGPITGGMVHPYLRRRNGEEEVTYPHPVLEPVLRKTLGIPLFQEQVMRLAVLAADYSPGEADQLRRDMAAWRRSGRIEAHRERLITRMVQKGIEAHFAEAVFDQIRGFGEYGFPESHAASFSLIAYATAWIKCHYPVVFACALLNAWPMGFYAPSTIVEDAKRHGVSFLPVDVIESAWECTLVPAKVDGVQGPRSLDGDLCIRMGLRWIKGLGKDDYERIERARNPAANKAATLGRAPAAVAANKAATPSGPNRAATTLAQFVAATALSSEVLDALSQAGAFGCFGVTRRGALWEAAGHQARHSPDTVPLDAALDNGEILPVFPELTEEEIIHWDHAMAGHSTTAHALEPYREDLRALGLPAAYELQDRQEGERVSYAGLVICRQRPGTANGTVFVTLEDESGFVNLVVWQRTFEKYRVLILTSSLLGITGKLQKNGATVYVAVESCWRPRLRRAPGAAKSRDFH